MAGWKWPRGRRTLWTLLLDREEIETRRPKVECRSDKKPRIPDAKTSGCEVGDVKEVQRAICHMHGPGCRELAIR